jgi:RNA polymerase sigma-70 factor, ECF subfamily
VEPNDPKMDREIADAVQAVLSGNGQAYAVVVQRLQQSMRTLCLAMLRDPQAADELAQDVFVHAYQRLHLWDARRPMKPWLVKIAYRLAQQRWRTQKMEAARQKEAAERLQQASKDLSDSSPWGRLFAEEQSKILWQAVMDLPLAQRTAVVLYYREGFAVEQVAKTMEIASGTVKTHLFRARAQIQANLQTLGFEEGDA